MRPVTECDRTWRWHRHKEGEFQSTHSITECDCGPQTYNRCLWYFNPRTPLQSATPPVWWCTLGHQNFNPRTPLQSATSTSSVLIFSILYFNPRTPLQSATDTATLVVVLVGISIHALHYRVRPQHIVVYSAILLVAAKNFCAIQVQWLIVRRFIAFVGANLPGKVCLL